MRVNKTINTIIKINPFLLILSVLIISYLISFITLLFPESANQNETEFLLETPWQKIIFGILIIPFLETIIFQTTIISIICNIIKRPKYNFYTSIIISAFAFSVSHAYNFYYLIYMFIIGIILAFVYYISRYRKMVATITIFLIHAIWNAFGFLSDYISTIDLLS